MPKANETRGPYTAGALTNLAVLYNAKQPLGDATSAYMFLARNVYFLRAPARTTTLKAVLSLWGNLCVRAQRPFASSMAPPRALSMEEVHAFAWAVHDDLAREHTPTSMAACSAALALLVVHAEVLASANDAFPTLHSEVPGTNAGARVVASRMVSLLHQHLLVLTLCLSSLTDEAPALGPVAAALLAEGFLLDTASLKPALSPAANALEVPLQGWTVEAVRAQGRPGPSP